MPGPPPKRSAERRRRNKNALSAIQARGKVRVPMLPKETHSIARKWYESLKKSA